MTKFPMLAGLAEVAGLAGVSRSRAGQLAAHPDFPEPVQRLAMGPVWLEADRHSVPEGHLHRRRGGTDRLRSPVGMG